MSTPQTTATPDHPTLFGVDIVAVGWIPAMLAVAVVVLAIYAAVTVRDPMAKRIKALNARREELKAGIVVAPTRKRASIIRRNATTDRIRGFLQSLSVLQESQVSEVQQKLAQAGIRKKEWGVAIILARLICPIAFGGLTALVVFGTNLFPEWPSYKRFGAFGVMLLFGYLLPNIWLANLVGKRTAEVRKGLPDALDLLVICAEAGLTVDTGFARVARELGRAYPELADEFALTTIELAFLNERRQAFENLSYRVNLEAVKGVTATLIQTEKYGTPLASSLRVLSAEFRNERMMRAEEKAARLPAIMTVPLILFILPTLFVVILGPAACSIADNFVNKKIG